MRRMGDDLIERRSIALLALALSMLVGLPLLVGAVMPPAPSVTAMPKELSQMLEPIAPGGDDASVGRPSPVPSADLSTEALSTETLVGAEPPTRPATATQTHQVRDEPPPRGERSIGVPTLRSSDPGWTAQRLEIPALGINVSVALAGSTADELFPPHGGAYILRSSSQPGRGTNSYIFAHAMPDLFKPLWWAQAGQQVIVTMSDGQQLGYRITAIIPDVPCPDATKPKPADLPPALANATHCDLSWTLPTPSERISLQTSQGFNRNYGELVIIAEPDWRR
ncbi:MAG: sortase [Candidatus Limnocylindria bacterium]